MTLLYIPRALPTLMLVIGTVVEVSSVRGTARRLEAMTASTCADCLVAPSALRSPMGLVLTAIGILLGAAALLLAARWFATTVHVDAHGIRARVLLRHDEVRIDEVKGVVLRQREGVPQLRIVRVHGDPVVVPAWSLRAKEDDEVEPAAAALQRLGALHGFKVKVISLTSPRA